MKPQIIFRLAMHRQFRLCFLMAVFFALAAAGSIRAQTNAPAALAISGNQTNVCIENLALLQAAKQHWASSFHKSTNDTPTAEDVSHFFKERQIPICPSHGEYTIGRVGELVSCNIPGHQLTRQFLAVWDTTNPLHLQNKTNVFVITDAGIKETCLNYLRQIDGAKQQWALENHKSDTAIPTSEEIAPFLVGGKFHECPAGGKYTIGTVNQEPTCSIRGHGFPQP